MFNYWAQFQFLITPRVINSSHKVSSWCANKARNSLCKVLSCTHSSRPRSLGQADAWSQGLCRDSEDKGPPLCGNSQTSCCFPMQSRMDATLHLLLPSTIRLRNRNRMAPRHSHTVSLPSDLQLTAEGGLHAEPTFF